MVDKPKPAVPIPAWMRGLSGDRRILLEGQSAQMIDIEFDMPRPMLIVVALRDLATPGAQPAASMELTVGVNRAPTDAEVLPVVNALTRAVLARSVTLIVRNASPNGGFVPTAKLEATAVIVPIDVNVPVAAFGGSLAGANSVGGANPMIDSILGRPRTSTGSIAQNVASVALTTPGLGDSCWRGASIYNDSTANLYVKLGTTAASLTDFTVRMVPNSFYETPFGYSGAIRGIWDAAGAGAARVTYNLS